VIGGDAVGGDIVPVELENLREILGGLLVVDQEAGVTSK
jgi:hypothetical protein